MEIDIKEDGGTFTVSLSGWIMEDSDFSQLPSSGATNVIVDLQDVTRINSCGLRSWVKWMESFDSDAQVILKNCPPWVVDQVNILDGFTLDHTTVESFYVPYYCDECEKSKNIKKVLGQDYSQENVDEFIDTCENESVPCDECGEAMEMDAISDKFFGFLKKS